MEEEEVRNVPPGFSSLEELTKQNIEIIAELERQASEARSVSDRIADAVASFCGSITFAWAHLVWFSVWIVMNNVPTLMRPFDPFPFSLLTLSVSLEAIFLTTFVIISQNRETRISERRNHLDLQINLLSEQENSKMIYMLEMIMQHLGLKNPDPEAEAFTEKTEPANMMRQIENVLKSQPGEKNPSKKL